MSEAPQIVVVGAASRDLVDDDVRGWRLGGGVSYSALALARLGLRVRAVVGVDGPAATADELDLLRAARAEVHLVHLERGPVFVNRETPDGRVQESREVCDPIPVEALPDRWAVSSAWLFAPVAAEVPAAWVEVPPPGGVVAVGWQGLLRVLVAGGPVGRVEPVASPLIARADLVGVGIDDFARDTPLERLASFVGPAGTLLVTDGVRGGTSIETAHDGSSRSRLRWAAIPTPRLVDPTGAGDTFLAAVLAARVAPAIVGGRAADGVDLRFGAAAASLVCERPGLLGVPWLAEVLDRLHEADATRG
jgi:sugar/nucleoside kinase (ribokinase family)